MKRFALFLAVAIILFACPTYDSLPEPELPVVDVAFSGAVYDSSTHSIRLDYQNPVSYDGIYPFYNKEKTFTMAYYIKGDIGILSSLENKNGITIDLIEGRPVPSMLVFDTKSPWYFYNRVNSWNYIIEAKAYIITPSISVVP